MSNDKPRDGLQLDISHAYEILGLKPGASQVEVKQAYRKLVKIWHPDRFVDNEQKQQAETKIKRINAAYNRVKSVTPTVEKPASATPSPKKPVKASVNRWGAETFYNWGVESVDKKEYEERSPILPKQFASIPATLQLTNTEDSFALNWDMNIELLPI